MKKEILITLMVLVFVGFVFAIPSIPNAFSGTVTYSVDPSRSLVGQEITASIAGSGLGVVGKVQSENIYNVMVDPQGKVGEIVFYIGGIEASPGSSYNAGEFTQLDLVIDSIPQNTICGNGIQEAGEQCDGLQLGTGTCENVLGVPGSTGTLNCTTSCTFDFSGCSVPSCGDGVCSGSETCTTCNVDCGSCSSGSSGSGSSGSSGSGSSGSSSNSNSQAQNNNNSGISSVDVQQASVFNIPLNDSSNETTSFFSKITGAVVGGGVTSGIVVGIFILLVIGAFVVIARKRTSINEIQPVKKFKEKR